MKEILYDTHQTGSLSIPTPQSKVGSIWLHCITLVESVSLDIYGHGKNVQKSQAYGPLPIYHGAFNTHTAIDKTIHGRKRRIVSQGFSDAVLRASEPFILDKVSKLCDGLLSTGCAFNEKPSNEWTKSRDMAKWSTLSHPQSLKAS